MSRTASEIFDVIAPELATDPNKDLYLELAAGRISTCAYGTNYTYAVALMAAHIGTLATQNSGDVAGSIASKKEGDLAVSYHNSTTSSGASGDLGQTSYGVQLDGLRRGNVAAIGVTGGAENGCISLLR